MSNVDPSSSTEPSGLVTLTSSVKAPEAGPAPGRRGGWCPARAGWITVAVGELELVALQVTRTGQPASDRLVSLTGIVLDRDVSVMRNWSGSVTGPVTVAEPAVTRST